MPGALAFTAAYYFFPLARPLPAWAWPIFILPLFLRGRALPRVLLAVLLGIALRSGKLALAPGPEIQQVSGTIAAPWSRSEFAHRTLLATVRGTVPLFVGDPAPALPAPGDTVSFRGKRILFEPPEAGPAEGPGFGYQLKSARQLRRTAPSWWRRLLYAPLRFNETLYRRVEPRLEPRPALHSLVKTLVFGRYDASDEAFFDAFRRGGVLHLLAISGLHVGVFLLYLLLLLRLLRAPPWAIAAAAVLFLLLYAGFCGWRAPVLRAALMGGLHYLGILLRRPQAPLETLWTSLPLNALLMPHSAFTAGFWLSYLAAYAVMVFLPASAGYWKSLLWTGVPVQIFLSPFLLLAFGSFSWGAVLLNPVLIPLCSLLLLVLPVAVLAPAPLYLDTADALSRWTMALVEGFGKGAWWGAYLPYPSPWLVALYYGAVVLAVANGGMRNARPLRSLAVASLSFAFAWGLTLPVPGRRVVFLDVGQGAATLFQDGDHSLLVDTGKRAFGQRLLPPLLRSAALPLDALVLSHPDGDHDRWAERIVRDAPPGSLLFPAVFADRYRDLTAAAEARGVIVVGLEEGMRFHAGSWRFTALHPRREPCGTDNACSLVLLAEGEGRTILLLGDAERAGDRDLLRHIPPQLDALEAAHHGSRSGTSPLLLQCLRPRSIVISVGADNPYGHPHRDVLGNAEALRIFLWRTDQRGSFQLPLLRPDGR
jgi:competence protein ComEC